MSIPLGKCFKCGKNQIEIAEGGYWVNGLRDKWVCLECKKFTKSTPMACEWCTYEKIIKTQLHTYKCLRCQELKIGQFKN